MEGVLERWKIFVDGFSTLRGRTTQMTSLWLDGTMVCCKIKKIVVNSIYTKSIKNSTTLLACDVMVGIPLRSCLDVVGFASIHMCWGGLEWNLN